MLTTRSELNNNIIRSVGSGAPVSVLVRHRPIRSLRHQYYIHVQALLVSSRSHNDESWTDGVSNARQAFYHNTGRIQGVQSKCNLLCWSSKDKHDCDHVFDGFILCRRPALPCMLCLDCRWPMLAMCLFATDSLLQPFLAKQCRKCSVKPAWYTEK